MNVQTITSDGSLETSALSYLSNTLGIPEERARDLLRAIAKAGSHKVRVRTIRSSLAGTTPHVSEEIVTGLIATLLESTESKEAQIFTIIERLFKAGDFEKVILVSSAAAQLFELPYRCLNLLGRAQLNLKKHSGAIETLSRIRDKEPKRHGAIYYLGVAQAREQLFQEAYNTFTHCLSLAAEDPKYHLEAGRAAAALSFGGYGVTEHRGEYIGVALSHFKAAAELAKRDYRPLREMAPLLVYKGEFTAAVEAIDEAVKRAPEEPNAWLERSRVYARLGIFDAALEACKKAADLDPNSDGAKFGVRILQRFRELTRRSDLGSISVLASGAGLILGSEVGQAGSSGPVSELQDLTRVRAHLKELDVDWVVFHPEVNHVQNEARRVLAQRGYSWAAGIEIELPSRSRVVVWRRAFLLNLCELQIFGERSTVSELEELAEHVGALARAPAKPVFNSDVKRAGTVLLVSQFGIHKFGGAEQFLAQMAKLYVSMGYEPLMVGTRSEFVGDTGKIGGLRYCFVEGRTDELFRIAVQEDAKIVHVVSGLGFEVAAAMRFLDVKLIFGVHFWRELFYNPTPSAGYFPNIDVEHSVRPEFSVLIRDFDAIYSNSKYTQGVLEQTALLRTPIIYSLPDDVSSSVNSLAFSERDGVLLVNARADKGFELLLAIAALLPDVQFFSIASQSGKAAAEAPVLARGLPNVKILTRVDNMDQLYRSVRAVMVPSYRFVETFSRVVIEAQRFGVPVVGSNRGNVPHLLTESGISLVEDPKLWAAEIQRLNGDVSYWNERSKLALDNSARYSFAHQQLRLSRVVDSLEQPILVGVGSGLGNVLHTTPLIRNIARRLGRRIDIVVAGDYIDLLFCVANEEFVGHAFILNENVLARRYDTVFLTHSFGSIVPRFEARNVIESRSWDSFAADHAFHEVEFNLAAAADLLGIGYDDEDVCGYFVGNYKYSPPLEPLIGIHSGSKDGIWATKRWPHFAELALRLSQLGYKVASFGTSDEYVPGTIDMTGGTIEEMTQKLLTCSHFVANDSGVMNLANALGIPLVSLFGPTNVQTRGPLMPSSLAVAVEGNCAPCEMHPTYRSSRFLAGTCRCIADIQPNRVLEALECIGLSV